MKKLSAILAISLAVLSGSCKKESTEVPNWFQKHSRFYYDQATDTSYTPDYRKLSIYKQQSSGNLFIEEAPVDTSTRSWYYAFSIFGNRSLYLKPDGIYMQASNSCGMGIISFSFDYLFIPAHATPGALIPQYGCERRHAGDNEILHADTVITVPAGRFHTFYVQHPNKDRSYWNRDIGMIMYEQYQHDPTRPAGRLSTLKLNRME